VENVGIYVPQLVDDDEIVRLAVAGGLRRR
jgi:hypothetical protein